VRCAHFGTFAALTLARSLRSLWHVRCAHFGTLASLAFVEEEEASTLPKRAERAYKRPKAVQKAEGRTKGRRPYKSERSERAKGRSPYQSEQSERTPSPATNAAPTRNRAPEMESPPEAHGERAASAFFGLDRE